MYSVMQKLFNGYDPMADENVRFRAGDVENSS